MYKNIAVLALLALSPLTSCSKDAPTQDSTSIYAAEIKPSRAWAEPVIDTIEKGGIVIEYFEKGPGTAAQKFDRISVHYQGWTRNTANIFDSSYERGNTLSFAVGTGKVIKGWEVGFEGMTVGTRARLNIPNNVAYGNRPPMGSGIPKNADLVFDVELVKIGK